MPDAASDQFQNITKELYSKNVDLVNANKVLELIQELYDIMISSYSVESVSHRFINVICAKMGFSDGLVLVPEGKSLKISGLTQNQMNQTVMAISGVATVNFKFDISDANNLLVKVYNSGKSKSSKKIYDIWTPYIRQGDLANLNQTSESQLIMAYPILYGKQVLGSFALVLGNRSDLSKFEKNALDKIVTVFGIAMDRIKITEQLQKVHESELSKAREIIKLKDEFVFIATHDLRTPVTAIKGFSELLSKEIVKLSADAQEDFDAISQSADRLDQLVEDLLEVARSESGTIYIETKPVLIKEIVDRAVNEVKTNAEKRKIVLNINLENDTDQVLGDKEKLNEVFENLLSNAVKYNKDGGSVTLKSFKENNFINFEISDTGIGIPQALQGKIFEKFFRARQIGTEDITGTGLGLFVVRMLTEKMKGKISFKSTEGQGTTFNLKLPLALGGV